MTLRRPLRRALPALACPGFVLLSALVLIMLFGIAGQALAAEPAVAALPAADAPAAPVVAPVLAPAAVPATVPAAAPATAIATLPAKPPAPMATANPSAGNLLQTIFALCVVLGLLGILTWVLKRYGPKQTSGSANLRLVGALNLGGRERIMVVEVGDQWIVVGASPGRVNALATMPKQNAPSTIALESYQPSASSFAEWLKQTIEKRK